MKILFLSSDYDNVIDATFMKLANLYLLHIVILSSRSDWVIKVQMLYNRLIITEVHYT